MKNSFYFLLILGIGLALRVYGVHFGPYHADEPIVVNHALAYGTGDWNPHFFKIPPLVSYLLFGVYGFFFLLGKLAGVFPNLDAFQAFFVQKPLVFYIVARLLFGVFLGTLTVALLYLFAKKHFSQGAAFFSALFLAANFLHARDSHFIYADIPMTLCVLGAVFASLRLFEEGGLKNYLLAGFWTGAATAFKYNAALVGAAFFLAHFLREERKAAFLLYGATFAAFVYFLFNPFSLFDFRFFLGEILSQSGAEGRVGFRHHLLHSLAGSAGWLFLGAAFWGMAVMLKEKGRGTLVLFSFPFLFYLSLGVFSQHHERYVLPLLPFLSLGAGFAVDRLFAHAGKNLQGRVVAALCLAGILVFPLAKSAQAALLFSRPDTRDDAREWIEQNLPASAKIAFSHSFYRPVLGRSETQWNEILKNGEGQESSPQALKNELLRKYSDTAKPDYYLYFLSDSGQPPFSSVRPLMPFDVGAMRKEGIQYVVLYYGATPEHESFYESVRSTGKLLKRFTPYQDPQKVYSLDRYSPTCGAYSWAELFAREKFGPLLEIYEVHE